MEIFQSIHAVDIVETRKVKTWFETWRGRKGLRSRIHIDVERIPAAYMMQGRMIVHPSLYAELKNNVDVFNSGAGTFTFPPRFAP